MKLTAFKKAYYFIQFYSHFNLLPFIQNFTFKINKYVMIKKICFEDTGS